MKPNLLIAGSLLFILLFSFDVLRAQDRNVTGQVTSTDDGEGLPAVNVLIKGTSNGTVTDIDGNYNLTVPDNNSILVFSFIGFRTQEFQVDTRSVIDIQLVADVTQLGEVVITAVGIEREARDLSYSVTTVSSEEITKTKSNNLLTSLQGKVPGATIQTTSGQPGTSQQIILRGIATLTNGSGQPLIVVDGIPVNNSQLADFSSAAGLNGVGVFSDNTDAGNGLNDIEPENIKSVNVLKGISAAALYGSSAANGAIIITTKDGRGKKASEVTYSGSWTWESPLMLPKVQTVFGLGQFGENVFFNNDQETWGDAYDGSLRPWSQIIDNQQLFKNYSPTPQSLREAFNFGSSLKNTVTFSGGGDNSNFFTSYSYLDQDGIVPGTGQSRHNLKLTGGSELDNNISIRGSMEFINSEIDGSPQGFGGNSDAGFYANLLRTSADLNTNEARDFENKFYDVAGYFTPFNSNPFRAAVTWEDITKSNRLTGNVEMGYKANDWLNFTVRGGGDFISRTLEQYRPIEVAGPPNNINRQGTLRVVERNIEEVNVDALASMHKEFNDDLSANLILGYNLRDQQANTVTTQQPNLGIADFRSLNNGLVPPVVTQTFQQRRLLGAYTQLALSYRGAYHLEFQGRNDWSSTLPKDNNSFFYYSVSGNIIVTELTTLGPINFLKLKGSYAEVGNDAPVYSTATPFSVSLDPNINDARLANFPWIGTTGARAFNTVGNATLKPERTKGYEAGIDVGILEEKIHLDVTYYNQLSEDQITNVQVPAPSGYTSRTLNAGAIRNKGVEASLTAIPVETGNFRWSATVNFARNVSKVESLAEGLDQFTIAGFSSGASVNVLAIPGEEYGIWDYTDFLRDPNGNIIVNPQNGNPQLDNSGNKRDGRSINPDFTGAFLSTLSYKNLSFSFTFQGSKGGYFYSQTLEEITNPGKSLKTAFNNRNPWIVPGSVLANADGTFTPNTSVFVVDPNQYWNNGTLERSILPASYLKLREVALTFDLPGSWFDNIPVRSVSFSAIGRDLFLWTAEENKYADPEQALGRGQGALGFPGFELATIPGTRSYGFSLRATL